MSDDFSDPASLDLILRLATAWAEEQEARILTQGTPLTPSQMADARRVGVRQPERVRLLSAQAIPIPEHPRLQAAAEATGLLSPLTAGLALRYGIYLRRDVENDRFLIAHELVHTGQCERYGSVEAFLRQYLMECLTIGYPAAPLEQEAIRETERLRRSRG